MEWNRRSVWFDASKKFILVWLVALLLLTWLMHALIYKNVAVAAAFPNPDWKINGNNGPTCTDPIKTPSNFVFTSDTMVFQEQLKNREMDAKNNLPQIKALRTDSSDVTFIKSLGPQTKMSTIAGHFDASEELLNPIENEAHSLRALNTATLDSICQTDPISYWKLEEISSTVFLDYVGANDAGCVGLGCPVSTTGQVGNALNFDGVTDKVDVPASNDFSFTTTDDFSIEFWVNFTDDTCSGNKVFVSRYNGNSSWWVGCGGLAGKPVFSVRDSERESVIITGTIPITDSVWHHIAAVRDGINGQNFLYVDGNLNGSASAVFSGQFSDTQEINLGYHDISPGYRMTGALDEVAIYGRALPQSEIQSHYNFGLMGNGYCVSSPIITSTPVQAGSLGQPYSYDVEATGFPTPTYLLTTNPSGMTIDANTGVISWIPSADGIYSVTVKASNSAGIDSQSFNITVTDAPIIISTPVTDIGVGQPYNYDVNASGLPIITYTLAAAPSGMTINTISGMISWTPAVTGVFSVAVEATNFIDSDSQEFDIAVTEIPIITSTPKTAAILDQHYSYDVNATGFPAPTYSFSAVPSGMTIDTITGVISWTPGAEGLYSVTVEASNIAGINTQSFDILVVSDFIVLLPIILK